MREDSLKSRLINKFGEGVYKHTFKEEVESKCADVMIDRFDFKKYTNFFYRRKSIETNNELFRERGYYKTLWMRIYKEYGESVLRDYKDADDYSDMIERRREEHYRALYALYAIKR